MRAEDFTSTLLENFKYTFLNHVYVYMTMFGYLHMSGGAHRDQNCQIPWSWNYKQL